MVSGRINVSYEQLSNAVLFYVTQMAQSCGGEAVSMQGAVVKALVRLAAERPVVVFAAKTGELCEGRGRGVGKGEMGKGSREEVQ